MSASENYLQLTGDRMVDEFGGREFCVPSMQLELCVRRLPARCVSSSYTNVDCSATPVDLGLLLGFPRLQGAGGDAREWDTSSCHQGRSLFTPNMGCIHTFLDCSISVILLVDAPQAERPRDG